MEPAAPPAPNRALVLWIIWLALTASVPMHQVFLGGGWLRGQNAPDAPLPLFFVVGLAQLLAATAVRWFVLPRFREIPKKLV